MNVALKRARRLASAAFRRKAKYLGTKLKPATGRSSGQLPPLHTIPVIAPFRRLIELLAHWSKAGLTPTGVAPAVIVPKPRRSARTPAATRELCAASRERDAAWLGHATESPERRAGSPGQGAAPLSRLTSSQGHPASSLHLVHRSLRRTAGAQEQATFSRR